MVPCTSYLAEGQDPETVEKLMGNVAGLLVVGEKIEYVAVQQKPLFNAFPDCVAVTQLRIIFCRLRNFGLNMEFKTHLWEDVLTMQFIENTAGASITLKTAKVTEMMGYLPPLQARKVHDFAKEIEAEYAEQRTLEKREKAVVTTTGAVRINYALPLPEPSGPPSPKVFRADEQRKALGSTPRQQTELSLRSNTAFPVS